MRNVIKLTESQLKKMVKDTINEQGGTANYFDVYEKANGMRDGGARLEPTKDPNCKVDKTNNLDYSFYIWNNGTYMQQSNTDKTDKVIGKMNILSDKSYNIVFRDGEIYDSATNKIIPAPNKTSQINTTNCANQLIDIANDPSKRKILKFGCKTQGVKELQTILGVVGKDGVPTGYFGSKTKRAVIDFQKKNKLNKIEGIVGPETYKALTPNAIPALAKDIKEEFDGENDGENANEYLNSLFNTEDDYDGEPYRGDEEGFSNKMRQDQINKKMRLSSTGLDTYYKGGGDLKSNTIPRDEEDKEVKYSPIKSNDLPLDKYLEKKKMGNLDEEDLNDDNFNDYLDSLFTKD